MHLIDPHGVAAKKSPVICWARENTSACSGNAWAARAAKSRSDARATTPTKQTTQTTERI
jgi:hypothetical protein